MQAIHGYYTPVGGTIRKLNENMAIHSAPFMMLGQSIGARCTAVRMATNPPSVTILCPMPYGPESEKLLETIGSNNVSYIVAPDCQHHMGVQSWKNQFPNAQIIGIDGMSEKKANQGKPVDKIEVKDEEGMKDEITSLPKVFTDEFDVVYIPQHRNKELVLFHRGSKTVITADLIFNLPANEQYKGSGISPTWGLSYILKFYGFNSWAHNLLMGFFIDKASSKRQLEHILQWDFERIIPCHGDLVEGPSVRK